MIRYGQMALDHNRKHRPDAYSQIPDPAGFFAETGEQIAAAVSQLRDEILDAAAAFVGFDLEDRPRDRHRAEVGVRADAELPEVGVDTDTREGVGVALAL